MTKMFKEIKNETTTMIELKRMTRQICKRKIHTPHHTHRYRYVCVCKSVETGKRVDELDSILHKGKEKTSKLEAKTKVPKI